MTQHQAGASDEFDAAKIIVETLRKLERPQQERAMRFASESLGLKNTPAASAVESKSKDAAPARPIGASDQRPSDIKQFAAQKAPKSDQQFAAVVAYYYQFEAPQAEKRETINLDVLANAARLVNRKRPTRFVLNNAKNSGYLDAVSAGEFRINTVGENLVAITLPGAGNEGGRKTSKQKKKKPKKTGAKKKK
ncbi:MAG: hypothetical protein WC670_11890 [Pseudolabrys sp.]|jgi:hypothetical protein